jgi:hypothetical protein
MRELIRANRRLRAHEFLQMLACLTVRAKAIFTEDTNMRLVSAKFVPRVLAIARNKHSLSVAINRLQEAETGQNFMEGIITGEKTWVYGNGGRP